MQLRLQERAGLISDLKLQVPFPLHVCGVKLGKYVCDFVYREGGAEIVEDLKGFRTPLFKWKLKHFEAEYGKTVRIT